MFEFLKGLFRPRPVKARRAGPPQAPRPAAPPKAVKPPVPQKEHPKAAKGRELIALWRDNPIRILPPSPANVALGELDSQAWATEAAEADALFAEYKNGLGCNALMKSAERARKAGVLLPALRRHMAVTYIDLNGPTNSGFSEGQPELAVTYPMFARRDASEIAPKQFEWLIDCAEGLELDHKGLRKEFLIASRSIWTPALPLSPEKAWKIVDGYIQGE